MATRKEYLDIADQALREGDEATAIAAMDEAEKLPADAVDSDIPQVDSNGVPVVRQSQYVAPNPSLTDRAIGAGEAAIAAVPGGLAGAAGQLAGTVVGVGKSILDGTYGTQAGANSASQVAADYAQTASAPFMPRTETGQRYLQNIAQVAEPLAGLAPLAQEAQIIGNSARAASRVAPGAEAVTNLGKSPLEIEQSRTNFVKSRLEGGQTTNDLATKAIDNGRVVTNKEAQAVIDQGFEDGLVSAINSATPKNKSQLLKMVRISEQGKKDSRFATENRPSDVIGDSLSERIKFIKRTNKAAGNEIESAANNIKGIPVDYQSSLDKFRSDLDSAGISINENGALNFKGSDLEFSPGDKRLISDIYSRAKTIDGSDAYTVHKLKRLIDRTVDYGKGSQKGITSGGESIVKGFRGSVDSALDNAFPEYNAANTKYSDTINELNNFQKAVGNSIDLFGENADKSLGTVSRRLLSNAQSRVKIMDSIRSAEEVSSKYGANFDDDIMTQAMFANALEKQFGASAKTSLLGDLETAGESAVDSVLRGNATATGLAIEGARAVRNKLKGRNDENSYKALKALLTRKEK